MKLKSKITRRLLLVGIISILLTALSASFAFWYFYTDNVKNELRRYADTAAEVCAPGYSADKLKAFTNSNKRITLISEDGTVIYDSQADPDKITENHNDRPEVIEARKSGHGQASRDSATLGKTAYYSAVLLDNNNVLRVSEQTDGIFSAFMRMTPIFVFIALYVFAVCLAFSAEATKSIIKPIENMASNADDPVYEELIPFSNIIREQREKINSHIEKLRREKEKIDVLIANMSEGFVLVDMDKNVLMKNDSAISLLNANNVSNVNIVNFSRNENFLGAVDRALNGTHTEIELPLGEKVLQVLASPVFYDKTQNGVICIIMDITERKKAENIRREFTANVSHELKTPLTSISGYAEMIETGIAKPEDVKGFAHKISREAGRLVALIGDILKLSRLDESEIEKNETVNLAQTARECAEDLQIKAENNNVSLEISADDAYVKGDGNLLYELVYNLCDNAIRYNKPGGKVNITVSGKNGTVLKVADTGIGIPPEHQDRIFERFYRVDKSRSKETGGTGLGLAIVKYIAQQHGASVSLKSQEGKGTEITVTFNPAE